MTGAPVILEGRTQVAQVITDQRGRYESRGLEPGSYRVRVDLPLGVATDEFSVELQDGYQCAEDDFVAKAR